MIPKGSVNGDQDVNVLDVMKTVNIILGTITPTPWQTWAADMNNDGVVDVADIIRIINRSVTAASLAGDIRASAVTTAKRVTVDSAWSKNAQGNLVMAIRLSNATGVAGVQLDVTYNSSLATPLNVQKGALIASASGWSLYSRDLGGTIRILAFNGSAQGLTGGSGSIVTIEFRSSAKRKVANIAAVKLVDGAGSVIPSRIAPGS